MSARTICCPRNVDRASTRAIGTPKTMHRTVEASAVCRLSSRAVREASEVMSGTNWAQFTRLTTATSGSRMNSAPAMARANTQRGMPPALGLGCLFGGVMRPAAVTGYGLPNPAALSTAWPTLPVTKLTNAAATGPFLEPVRAAMGYVFTAVELSGKVIPVTLPVAPATSVT